MEFNNELINFGHEMGSNAALQEIASRGAVGQFSKSFFDIYIFFNSRINLPSFLASSAKSAVSCLMKREDSSEMNRPVKLVEEKYSRSIVSGSFLKPSTADFRMWASIGTWLSAACKHGNNARVTTRVMRKLLEPCICQYAETCTNYQIYHVKCDLKKPTLFHSLIM